MDSFNSAWPSPQRGIDGLSNDALHVDMETELRETFEPQTRARSNTWPLPRPDGFVEPTDDSGSTQCSNQQLANICKYFTLEMFIFVLFMVRK